MACQMNRNEKDGVVYLTFPALEQFPFLRHAFSTRLGGVSQGCFASMNLGFGRGDKRETVLRNYHIFCDAVGFDFNKLVASAQDHHTVIRRVSGEQAGIGIWRLKDRFSVDGLCTDEPGVVLVTYYADCVPLYFVDPVRKAVGLAHAGWRGTAARIGAEMVKKLNMEFGSEAKDIHAAIGPSIGPCCYEVDQPVADIFYSLEDLRPQEFVTRKDDGKFMLDLWECNRRILAAAGIPETNITVGGLCTKCNSDLLFSHRVMGTDRGSLAAMIALREERE